MWTPQGIKDRWSRELNTPLIEDPCTSVHCNTTHENREGTTLSVHIHINKKGICKTQWQRGAVGM